MIKVILASFFSPSQILTVVLIAVAVVLLIVLNIVLAYVFNKRGERKLIDKLLQQQREILMKQLDEMRKNGSGQEGNEEPYKPFFKTEIVYKEVIREVPADRCPEKSAQPEEVEIVAEEPLSGQSAEIPSQTEAVREEVQEALTERDFKIFKQISVREVSALMSDEVAARLVEVEYVRKNYKAGRKKAIINMDCLSENFGAGEYVNLEMLREKQLIAKETCAIKILAKGTLNKPLIAKADDFSIDAVKMILLTGGRAVRIKSTVDNS